MLTIDGFLQLVHALCCKSHNFEALFSCKTCSKINDNRPQCSKFNKNTEKKANLQSSLKNVFAFYLPLCKNALFKVTIHYVYIISVTESL